VVLIAPKEQTNGFQGFRGRMTWVYPMVERFHLAPPLLYKKPPFPFLGFTDFLEVAADAYPCIFHFAKGLFIHWNVILNIDQERLHVLEASSDVTLDTLT